MVYVCKFCDLDYSIRRDWKRHMLRIHGIQSYGCDTCAESFYEEEDLLKHVQTAHDGQVRHCCTQCSMTYKRGKDLALHIHYKHKIDELVACEKCGQEFHNTVAYKKHLQLQHKPKHVYRKCKKCPRSFRFKHHLKLHQEFDHARDGKKFLRDYLKKLNVEKSAIGDLLLCKLCKIKFNCSLDFIQHLKLNHSKKKSFACCQCTGAVYNSRASLGIHMRHEHGLLSHSCSKCPPPMKPSKTAPLKPKHAKAKIYAASTSEQGNLQPNKPILSSLTNNNHSPNSINKNMSQPNAPWADIFVKGNIPSDLELKNVNEQELQNLRHNVRSVFKILSSVPPSRLIASRVPSWSNKPRIIGRNMNIVNLMFPPNHPVTRIPSSLGTPSTDLTDTAKKQIELVKADSNNSTKEINTSRGQDLKQVITEKKSITNKTLGSSHPTKDLLDICEANISNITDSKAIQNKQKNSTKQIESLQKSSENLNPVIGVKKLIQSENKNKNVEKVITSKTGNNHKEFPNNSETSKSKKLYDFGDISKNTNALMDNTILNSSKQNIDLSASEVNTFDLSGNKELQQVNSTKKRSTKQAESLIKFNTSSISDQIAEVNKKSENSIQDSHDCSEEKASIEVVSSKGKPDRYKNKIVEKSVETSEHPDTLITNNCQETTNLDTNMDILSSLQLMKKLVKPFKIPKIKVRDFSKDMPASNAISQENSKDPMSSENTLIDSTDVNLVLPSTDTHENIFGDDSMSTLLSSTHIPLPDDSDYTIAQIESFLAMTGSDKTNPTESTNVCVTPVIPPPHVSRNITSSISSDDLSTELDTYNKRKFTETVAAQVNSVLCIESFKLGEKNVTALAKSKQQSKSDVSKDPCTESTSSLIDCLEQKAQISEDKCEKKQAINYTKLSDDNRKKSGKSSKQKNRSDLENFKCDQQKEFNANERDIAVQTLTNLSLSKTSKAAIISTSVCQFRSCDQETLKLNVTETGIHDNETQQEKRDPKKAMGCKDFHDFGKEIVEQFPEDQLSNLKEVHSEQSKPNQAKIHCTISVNKSKPEHHDVIQILPSASLEQLPVSKAGEIESLNLKPCGTKKYIYETNQSNPRVILSKDLNLCITGNGSSFISQNSTNIDKDIAHKHNKNPALPQALESLNLLDSELNCEHAYKSLQKSPSVKVSSTIKTSQIIEGSRIRVRKPSRIKISPSLFKSKDNNNSPIKERSNDDHEMKVKSSSPPITNDNVSLNTLNRGMQLDDNIMTFKSLVRKSTREHYKVQTRAGKASIKKRKSLDIAKIKEHSKRRKREPAHFKTIDTLLSTTKNQNNENKNENKNIEKKSKLQPRQRLKNLKSSKNEKLAIQPSLKKKKFDIDDKINVSKEGACKKGSPKLKKAKMQQKTDINQDFILNLQDSVEITKLNSGIENHDKASILQAMEFSSVEETPITPKKQKVKVIEQISSNKSPSFQDVFIKEVVSKKGSPRMIGDIGVKRKSDDVKCRLFKQTTSLKDQSSLDLDSSSKQDNNEIDKTNAKCLSACEVPSLNCTDKDSQAKAFSEEAKSALQENVVPKSPPTKPTVVVTSSNLLQFSPMINLKPFSNFSNQKIKFGSPLKRVIIIPKSGKVKSTDNDGGPYEESMNKNEVKPNKLVLPNNDLLRNEQLSTLKFKKAIVITKDMIIKSNNSRYTAKKDNSEGSKDNLKGTLYPELTKGSSNAMNVNPIQISITTEQKTLKENCTGATNQPKSPHDITSDMITPSDLVNILNKNKSLGKDRVKSGIASSNKGKDKDLQPWSEPSDNVQNDEAINNIEIDPPFLVSNDTAAEDTLNSSADPTFTEKDNYERGLPEQEFTLSVDSTFFMSESCEENLYIETDLTDSMEVANYVDISTTSPNVSKEGRNSCDSLDAVTVDTNTISKREYNCKFCTLKCDDEIHLLNHLTESHSHYNDEKELEALYKCGTCGSGFRLKDSLDRHVKNEHLVAVTFNCHHCSAVFFFKYHLKAHIKADHGLNNATCDNCKAAFTSQLELSTHRCLREPAIEMEVEAESTPKKSVTFSGVKRSKKGKVNKIFVCDMCNINFKSGLLLYNHNRNHHIEPVYKCEMCSVAFRQKKKYLHHKCIATQVECKKCNVTFVSKELLVEHKKEKHNMGSLKCDYCTKYFKTNQNLMKHTTLKHFKTSEYGNLVRKPSKPTKKSRNLQNNDIYNDLKIINQASENPMSGIEVLNSNDADTAHRITQTSQENKKNIAVKSPINAKQTSGVNDHMCKTCKLTFSSKIKLMSHSKVHITPRRFHKCLMCLKKFPLKTALLKHIKHAHNLETNKIHRCQYCCAVFKFEDKLEQHYKLKHTENEKETSASLITNDDTIQTVSSTPKGKSTNISHVVHQTPEILTNEMFGCKECSAYLPSNDSLQRHIQLEHQKVHTCGHCSKVFTSTEGFWQHLITGHGDVKIKELLPTTHNDAPPENSLKWKTQLVHNYKRQGD